MSAKQKEKNVSVDEVVCFCVKGFLDEMKKNNGTHKEPFEAVVKKLENNKKGYGMNRETAHLVLRPTYWTLVEQRILEYCQDRERGAYWRQARNNVDERNLVKIILDKYGDTLKERIGD